MSLSYLTRKTNLGDPRINHVQKNTVIVSRILIAIRFLHLPWVELDSGDFCFTGIFKIYIPQKGGGAKLF